jgi:hypothetical protein
MDLIGENRNEPIMKWGTERISTQTVAGFIGGIGLVASLVVGYLGWKVALPTVRSEPWDPIKIWEAIIVVAWILLPPLYFWYEYFFIFDRSDATEAAKLKFEQFKYGQDVSSKIWIAVSSSLLILYFGKDFKL